jgi:DNA-binding response OmpR family regulator
VHKALKAIPILLVDEDLIFLQILSSYLRDQHPNEIDIVDTGAIGSEAVVLGQTLQPRMIVDDLGLPGLRGRPSIRSLRKGLPKAAIIALTPLDSSTHRTAALQAGADVVRFKGNTLWI